MDKKLMNDEIIKCYETEDITALAKRLGITVVNLRKKASRLGVKKSTISNKIIDNKKRCACCGQWLEIDKFNKDKYQPNGLDYYCKKCRTTKPKKSVTKTVSKNKNSHNDSNMSFHKKKTHNPIVIVDGIECLRCKSCEQIKPLDQFHKDKNNKSGHKNFCKSCVSAKKRG